MKNLYKTIAAIITVLTLMNNISFAQSLGVVTHTPGSNDDGYVLFAPQFSDTTYLIDKCGRQINKWVSGYNAGLDAYLQEDGTLMRAGTFPNTEFDPFGGSFGGIIERYDWNGNLTWHYRISDQTQRQDHDICPLPNGNVIAAVWEEIPPGQTVAAGRNPTSYTTLWSAKLVEIKPIGIDSGEIVWQWRLMDHLVQDFDASKSNFGNVAGHPELLDINFSFGISTIDWIHLNSVSYNPDLDQVLISARSLDEIYVIDHSTTTTEAAGHTGGKYGKGGDFLYRWGNPMAYRHGTANDVMLYRQHDAAWIKTGPYKDNIMVFNNGTGRSSGNISSVDIIGLPRDTAGNYIMKADTTYGPDTLLWTYQSPTPTDFYSMYMGGAQILNEGHVMICQSMPGRFFELDSSKNIVWDYYIPINNGVPVDRNKMQDNAYSFRCVLYPSDYPGLAGKSLTPGTNIELNASASPCAYTGIDDIEADAQSLSIFPNPATDLLRFRMKGLRSASLISLTGEKLLEVKYNNAATGDFNVSALPSGVYILCVNGIDYKRVLISH